MTMTGVLAISFVATVAFVGFPGIAAFLEFTSGSKLPLGEKGGIQRNLVPIGERVAQLHAGGVVLHLIAIFLELGFEGDLEPVR